MGTRLPWERQGYDSEESWPLFVAYRDQRAPRRVPWSGRYTASIPITELVRRFREDAWKERVAEYDAHLDDIRRAAIEAQLAESSRDVAAHTMSITSRAREVVEIALQNLLDRAQKNELFEMKPNEITRMLQVTAQLDRLLRGESTEKIDLPVRDLSHLSDAELDEIERLMEHDEGD
jgi:hypothetical protein